MAYACNASSSDAIASHFPRFGLHRADLIANCQGYERAFTRNSETIVSEISHLRTRHQSPDLHNRCAHVQTA